MLIPSSVISSAIQTLVREFEAACEAAFLNMQRTAWATLSLVSGQSSYVDELTLAIEQLFELIKPRIEQKKYLRNFLDKASGFVVSTNSVKYWTKRYAAQFSEGSPVPSLRADHSKRLGRSRYD